MSCDGYLQALYKLFSRNSKLFVAVVRSENVDWSNSFVGQKLNQ